MGKSRGYRRRTRKILRKVPRKKGMPPLGVLLHEYNLRDKVIITIDPSVHKGMPHRRYHGKVGTISEKRGRSYVIELRDGNKVKTIIARPEHIKPHVD